MKERNSVKKFQMLVKLAFLLFWFARALASNEPKSLAANQNWNTPHDWPLKKIHCLTDQSGCKEIQIQFVVLWGLRTSISALLRRRINRNKTTRIEFHSTTCLNVTWSFLLSDFLRVYLSRAMVDEKTGHGITRTLCGDQHRVRATQHSLHFWGYRNKSL